MKHRLQWHQSVLSKVKVYWETGTLNCDFKNAVDSDEDTFGDGNDPSDNIARDEMTLNMKAAMQDLGDLFCSPRGVLKEYIDLSNDEDGLSSQKNEEDKVDTKSDNVVAPRSTFEIFEDGCADENVAIYKRSTLITDDQVDQKRKLGWEKLHRCLKFLKTYLSQ